MIPDNYCHTCNLEVLSGSWLLPKPMYTASFQWLLTSTVKCKTCKYQVVTANYPHTCNLAVLSGSSTTAKWFTYKHEMIADNYRHTSNLQVQVVTHNYRHTFYLQVLCFCWQLPSHTWNLQVSNGYWQPPPHVGKGCFLDIAKTCSPVHLNLYFTISVLIEYV